jgi:hypothetical protein
MRLFFPSDGAAPLAPVEGTVVGLPAAASAPAASFAVEAASSPAGICGAEPPPPRDRVAPRESGGTTRYPLLPSFSQVNPRFLHGVAWGLLRRVGVPRLTARQIDLDLGGQDFVGLLTRMHRVRTPEATNPLSILVSQMGPNPQHPVRAQDPEVGTQDPEVGHKTLKLEHKTLKLEHNTYCSLGRLGNFLVRKFGVG